LLDKLTSLVNGGSVGSIAVASLTGGYLWLQVMGEGVDNGFSMLLALSFLLYYYEKKQPAPKQPVREIHELQEKRAILQPQQLQQYPPIMAGSWRSPCHGNTPNITITVNGEKRSDCEENSEPRQEAAQPEDNKVSNEPCFYRIYKDKAGDYRWHLKVKLFDKEEGGYVEDIIATSHQGFSSLMTCLHEISKVMKCCHARIEEDIDGDGKPSVFIAPEPYPEPNRRTPYVDRVNIVAQDMMKEDFFRRKK